MNTVRVFLSPASAGLEPYHTRVANLVESLGQFTVVLSRCPPHPDGNANSASLEKLDSCDLYLLVLAWSYGHVPEDQELSVPHQEYREARRLDQERRQSGLGGLPCFVFLADERTDTDPTLFPSTAYDPEHREQLLAFRRETPRCTCWWPWLLCLRGAPGHWVPAAM